MSLENNLDTKNINLLLNLMKNNNENKNNDNTLLKINSINNSPIKNVLPILSNDTENIYKILNCLELNQLVTRYREVNKNIDEEQILNLKREAILHIKQNIGDKNKYLADIFLKAIEIKNIIRCNYKKENINGL